MLKFSGAQQKAMELYTSQYGVFLPTQKKVKGVRLFGSVFDYKKL